MTEFPMERMVRLVRIYHAARDASRATGHARASLVRKANEYGLRFRRETSLAEDAKADARYFDKEEA